MSTPRPARRRGPRKTDGPAGSGWADLRNTPYGLAPVIVIAATAFLQEFDTQAFTLAGPDIVRKFGINVASVVNIRQFVTFFAVFGGLTIAWLADRYKRVPIFVAGTAVSGIAAALTSFASSPLTLGAPRVVDDGAQIAGEIPARSMLADYYPPAARGRVYALYGIGFSAGSLLALPGAGAAITYLGLRASFVAFGIPLLLIAIVAAFVLREPVRGFFERKALGADDEVATHEDEPRSFGEAWRTVWAVRTLRRMFFALMIATGGVLVFQTFFGFLLFEHYGLSALGRGVIGVPTAIAAIIGGIVGGSIVDRFTAEAPARATLVFGGFLSLAGLGMIGVAFTPPLPLLVASTAVFGFGFALIGPAFDSVFSQVVPPNVRSQGLQITRLAALPTIFLVFPAAQRIYATSGYRSLFLFTVPFFVVAGLVAVSAGTFFDIDRRNAMASSMASEEWRKTRSAGQGKLLVCRGVDVFYDNVQVLFDVDLDVEEGEIIALLGTNGAGKSTLLRAISGTQEAANGAIVFDGRDITHMPPHETAARGVIHMPGGRGVFPALTVRENLMLGTWLGDDADAGERLAEIFDMFPALAERAGSAARVLSGGEQQQLSLAQAFLARPRLLMIDELSLGLAPAVVGQLLEIVREIHRRGVTIIIVEQSVNVALALAEKAVFMEKGEVRFFGPTADLLARPDILRAVYVKGTGGVSASGSTRVMRERAEQRTLLDVAGLTKSYGGVHALAGVDMTVADGEVLGLIGPNGSGKTTLFEVISGFQTPDAGTITFDGIDITSLGPEQRADRKLLRRFQDARLFPSLTVYENLLIALDASVEVKSPFLSAVQAPQARRSERRVRARADRLIELLELGSSRDKFARELSTGQRRIVDLAAVLAAEPRLLLLDEPSSGIAQAEAEALGPLLRRIRFETGCTILIIEHDMPLISSVADELCVLERGRVLTRGLPDDVLNDDRVIEAYLGGSEEAVRRSGSLA
jgi:ABC-type branched-subunit amino acid transport system ATPase component/MFS family permease